MKLEVTKRDKKLLSALGVIGVLLLFGVLVILPLHRANESMKEQIAANEEQITQMSMKTAGLPAAEIRNEELKQELAQAQETLYPMMRSQEIDQLLTDKVLRQGLTATSLQISMPGQAANVMHYGSAGSERENGSNPEQLDAVWIAEVSLSVSGSGNGLRQLADELSAGDGGIRVTSLRWGQNRRQVNAETGETAVYDTLSLQLQILMSRGE